MSARAGRPGMLATVLARAGDWLLDPVEPAHETAPSVSPAEPAPLRARPVVAVAGLGRRGGVTTVARALGAELAARERGACAVSCASRAGGLPLGVPAAGRLAGALSEVVGAQARPAGRLCLVDGLQPAELASAARYLAPLVLDVADPSQAAAAASLADHVVLVAHCGVEPALGAVTAASLVRVGPEPVVALNRVRGRPPEAWEGRAALALPEARMGAQLALGGREARGELGRAVAALADLCGVGP